MGKFFFPCFFFLCNFLLKFKKIKYKRKKILNLTILRKILKNYQIYIKIFFNGVLWKII